MPGAGGFIAAGPGGAATKAYELADAPPADLVQMVLTYDTADDTGTER